MAKSYKSKQADTPTAYNMLMASLKASNPAPVYLLEGEEGYYIDLILSFFENILPPDQKDFNLISLFGKEVTTGEVMNACGRFPMFADKTIVLLREATQIKGLDKLTPYLEQPAQTTILVIDYRGKNTTAKDKWATAIQQRGVIFKSNKVEEKNIPAWIQQLGGMQGYTIAQKEAETLAAHLGNNLQNIHNELEKVRINEPELEQLSAETIEKYIGISRDYDFRNLPTAILNNDKLALTRMLEYFTDNPKSAPLPALVGTFYSIADKIYRCYAVPDDYNNPESRPLYYFREYARRFSLPTIHKFIAVINELATKAVGINTANSGKDNEILKEITGKMIAILHKQQ